MAWVDEYRLDSLEGETPEIHIGGLGEQQVKSLRAVFEADGIELRRSTQQKGVDLARLAQEARGLEVDASPR